MSEELNQRDLINNPEKIGKWEFRNIGGSTFNQLKNAGIIPNKTYKGFDSKRPDALISIPKVVDAKIKTTIAVVENKSVSKFKTKTDKQKAIKQGLEYAKILDAKILIVTDTTETLWINALNGNEILDEKGRHIKTIFNPKNQDLEKLIEQIILCIDKTNSQLKEPKLIDPTDLAKRIWQILWSISGATPESCLYSFVELFIFKYLSDLGVLQNDESFDNLLKMYKHKEPEKVIEYYARNIRLHIKNDLFPKGSDGTTIINGTVFVNNDDEAIEGRSTAFKKILEEFNSYGKLENIHPDFKSKLFETFLKESLSEKKWGQFFTPLKVVKAIVEMAKGDIRKDIKICDPAGGVGKFLLEAIKPQFEDFYRVEKDKLISDIEIFGYDIGFDKDEQKTIILAKANMLIYFSELIRKNREITKEFSNLFNNSFELKKNSILGTLAVKENEVYDLILSNPPYVTSGSSNIKAEIKRKNLEDHYKINAMGLEGLFMEWIIKALKPSGKAFVVVPDGIFNRQNDKNLRQYILDECHLDGIISLPLKTFFSTSKKTYILCITKKKNKATKQTDPVFTYLVSEIGESRDTYRFDIEQDNLKDAVELFNQFKSSTRKTFKANDKRLKIQPIEKFDPETHWSVERWWSKEEQIELGVIEEEKLTKFEDFPAIIEEVANNILSFKEELLQLNEKKKSNLKISTFKVNELFKIVRGNGKYIKKYIDKNIGNYPVYSGNTYGEFARINSFDYGSPCLSWAIDGLAGFMMIHNEQFSATNHRGLLFPKNDLINLEYAKYILEPIFRKNKKGRINEDGKNEYTALPPFMIENLEINIPVNSDLKIDIIEQDRIVEKIKTIQETKSKIESYKKLIEESNVEILEGITNTSKSIKDFFSFHKGTNDLNKLKIENKKGIYPVYSGQTTNNGIIGYIDSYKYDCKCIRITTVGINAGHIDLVEGKFSLAQNNCILVPNEKFINIDIEFIKFLLNGRTQELTKGDIQQKSLLKNAILDIQIQIPITSSGEYDLAAQQEIAAKYKKIEQIKKSIAAELDKISKIEIEYE
jgi:type I restriction-modification system DNA methylase subunit